MADRTHAERRAAGIDVLRTLRGGDVDGAAASAANEARLGLESLQRPKEAAGGPDPVAAGDAELARLAQGASFEAVLGTASRLRMPDLLDFLR